MILSSYSSALIIADGSGVAFALSEAEEVVPTLLRDESRVKFIEVIWITHDMNAQLSPLYFKKMWLPYG